MLSDRVIELDLAARERAHERRRQKKARPKNVEPRRDIQGLRAVAVLAVVLNHLTGWPAGGFVGVDVFFVVSGFLITGLLLRQQEEKGRISFTGFYRKRVKRIIPAAVLVLVTTVVAAHFAFNTVRFKSTAVDAFYALVFASNWRFKSLATDYFNANRPKSPVQHFWSLSIEEQFYFVWPWLMLAVFVVLARRGWSHNKSRVVVGVVIGAIVAASFVYALAQTSTDVTGAYFSSLTRAWELGVGAALAVAAPLCSRIPLTIRPVLAWLGLVSILVSLFFVGADQGFPAPAAAWPVLSTALVIAAGTGVEQQRRFAILTNRPTQFVGDASYSLYLWHFPVIIIGEVLIGDTVRDKVVLAVAMSALAYFAFVLWENPLRHARWTLFPGSRSHHGRRSSGTVSSAWKINAVVFAAALTLAISAAAVAHVYVDPPTSALSTLPIASETPSGDAAPKLGPQMTALQAKIRQSLSDTAWPSNLNPTMDEAIGGALATPELQACAVPVASVDDCAWGPADAGHVAMLVGDSEAIAYSDALRAATLAHGWRFLSRTATACPFVDLAVNVGQASFNPDCPDVKAAAVRDIKTVRPDVLFVVNHEWSSLEYPVDDWIASSEQLLAKTGDAVGRVVYVTGPIPAPDPVECYTPSSLPGDCTGRPTPGWREMISTQEKLADENGGLVVYTEDWFCFGSLCPPYVGTTPVRPDGIHVLQAYTASIQPAINETLNRAGVFRP